MKFSWAKAKKINVCVKMKIICVFLWKKGNKEEKAKKITKQKMSCGKENLFSHRKKRLNR